MQKLIPGCISTWPTNRWLLLKPVTHSEKPYEMCQSCLLRGWKTKAFICQFPPLYGQADSSDIKCPALLNALQDPKNVPHSMCQRSLWAVIGSYMTQGKALLGCICHSRWRAVWRRSPHCSRGWSSRSGSEHGEVGHKSCLQHTSSSPCNLDSFKLHVKGSQTLHSCHSLYLTVILSQMHDPYFSGIR